MSEQPHTVLIRMGCAKLLLRKAIGREEHAIISRVQKSALLDFLQKHNMKEVEPDELAKMVAMLQECAFTEEDKMALMSELAPPTPPHEATKRLPMQKFFPRIMDYFLAEEWSTMKEADMHTASNVLHGRIVALGGRNLSEKCCASLTSLLLYVCGMRNATDLVKNQLLTMFKAGLKRKVRFMTAIDPYLVELPPPHTLKETQPCLYKEVFPHADPTASQIDLSQAVLPTVGCRVSSKVQGDLQILDRNARACTEEAPLQILNRVVAMQQDSLELVRRQSQQSLHSPIGALAGLVSLSSSSSSERAPPFLPPPPPHPFRMPSFTPTHLPAPPLPLPPPPVPAALPAPLPLPAAPPAPLPLPAAKTVDLLDTQLDDALVALHTVNFPDSDGEGNEKDLVEGESGELIEESQEQLVAAGPTVLGQPSIVMGSGASGATVLGQPNIVMGAGASSPAMEDCSAPLPGVIMLGQPSMLQQPPPVVQQQLVEQHPPSAQAPNVARQLLADFASAKAKAKTRSAKAKPSAKAPPKSKAKAKAKAVAVEAKAKATVDAGVSAKRKLNLEAARKTWRCRFPDGTSKGFSYTGDEDKEAKRQEAQACLDAAYDAWASQG